MSGLQTRTEDTITGVDVREQGNALRVATNTPHLVSLGTGRLSTAVTLHPIKQGRVTIGSDPTCDIYVLGSGVASVHCRVENSHGVVTLYPISGSTQLDSVPVDKPTRLSQGSMLTIGRSNYLRFNHPAEAKLMKSVLPSGHSSTTSHHVMHLQNNDCSQTGYQKNQCYQTEKNYKDNLSHIDEEFDIALKEISKKPPLAPKKTYRDQEQSDSNSDQESSKPKLSSIMSKVSKFEYYAKQQKCVGRSQFYTTNELEFSPKVFSSNSLTVNTPAKDVLGGKTIPNYMRNKDKIAINENNSVEVKNCSYANVTVRNRTKTDDIVNNKSRANENIVYNKTKADDLVNIQIRNDENVVNNKNRTDDLMRNKTRVDEIVRNIDEYKLPKKVNNDQQENVYGKINNTPINILDSSRSELKEKNNQFGAKTMKNLGLPSPAFDRNPQYSPVYVNHYDRSYEAESRRVKAYQDRVKEEEQKDVETARLEEILNMCAEYEKQIASGVPITPTERRAHNKIITNGSLPRSVALNNPNFVQTSDGYYKFETSHRTNTVINSKNKSIPMQRNLSSYENFDISGSPTQIEQLTPEVTITTENKEKLGRMDEIGIPVFDETPTHLSSPIMIKKNENRIPVLRTSPVNSPYENVLYKNSIYSNMKPKSPNTQSPRTRIKTSFAHKNLNSPQYFVFPSPPPSSKQPNFEINEKSGIEKQLSLEEEIPMIDDIAQPNDIEFRYSKKTEKDFSNLQNKEPVLAKEKSFEDVKKELMVDIPELEQFEKDLEQNKREKIIKNVTEDVKTVKVEVGIENTVLDESVEELKAKYDRLKEEKKKLVAEIHGIKCKMSEIRLQEDDVLRELEMEKALIKGEYDSEIAILNIEQQKKFALVEKAKKIEEEIRELKKKQETRQNEMRDRVEIATLKVERIEKNLKNNAATVEELQNAQDILDNETKMSEDLEFQHLEEESELLSNREDLQNEIILLTKKIEAQKTRILTLKSEANNNLTSALDETKVLHAEYVKKLNLVEELTGRVQYIEKDLKPIVVKLNELERNQSPDSAFYTDHNRGKSGEYGYSPQSSDSDDELKINLENRTKKINDKFNSIDQMSQSMTIELEKRITNDEDDPNRLSESPSKTCSSKEKKGFWERNFDSLKRKNKKPKSPEKVDVMSQSLNENFFYNNDNIESDFDRFNSLRNSKKKDKNLGPVKCSSSSKIPTFAALGKIIRKDSLGKKSKDTSLKNEDTEIKNRYIKNLKPVNSENKYVKSKSLSPDKIDCGNIAEETAEELSTQKNRVTFELDKVTDKAKVLHRKSCGDEPNIKLDTQKMSDSGKVPSQDDIDRISKVTIDAPILPTDADMNSLGKRTLDSLMEVERRRLEMLEEQGCQVIENEREKISELKRKAQDETKKLWDQKYKDKSYCFEGENNQPIRFQRSDNGEFERSSTNEKTLFHSLLEDSNFEDSFIVNSTAYDESSGLMSSSIEELQVRNSRTESTEDDKRSDESRPLSHTSDFSRDNILSLSNAPRRSRRGIASYNDAQRPLTRYLPIDRDDFDLRRHVETAGHQLELCSYLMLTSTSCRGYLHKLGAKFHTWSKRWFVFDRETKTFVYYWDKSEKKPRGGAYFQVIEEVYMDHGNTSKSPNPQTTFIVKTRQRKYYLMAPSAESARIWIDVIFTGAQGYTDYLE